MNITMYNKTYLMSFDRLEHMTNRNTYHNYQATNKVHTSWYDS